ncbi:rhomboid family intramembrane serine protease [Marinimicrobium agarilyticum]|uniref:rhomboid family intramembrane serine protease n=1 Tax=Marinimicrobium agarilyticum TaxID=306546 RepID=UPI0004244A10|nr:rhomboid family intramembrane serine protease [Marinimicrobium agarilyticum]
MPSTMARCPNCVTLTLVETRTARQAVLQCDHCRGVWFEDGALNRAIAHKHEHIDEYDHEEHLGAKIGKGDRLCRRCDSAMERYHLLKHYEVEVDCCPSCDGVWLDRHEVTEVMQSPQLKDALATLNRSTSWRSWAFQLLTQMPVEFNLKAHRTPWVTYGIIVLCSLLFIAGQVVPGLEMPLYAWLGFNSDAPSWLQPFQLVTHQFMHGSWMHLLGNMYFLWLVGDNIEDALGHWRYLMLYLVSGIAAALAEWLFFDASGGPLLMVGASGSIAALFGVYMIWFRYASLTMMIVVFQIKLAPHWYFLFWSGFNIVGMLIGDTGVAYWAHLGGFLFGLVVGLTSKSRIMEQNLLMKLLNQPEIRVQRSSR